ncbi:DUF2169 family type VI secretion system accessory protein [Agrobacterium vitis]|uniref:DUF2169 domain-containing protein n=1 Tax=Agrobacterium vitis TaxID=373 RepID=A0AAE2RAU0_AGRVI|nr:DUF2169 domain-containing protein [Agrobacterium vitis]MBF2714282.1 DUF2169 domain-containing protein [Agrobacterium vitis]
MLGKNLTRFAAIGFEQAHRDGEDMGVIAVRGRYQVNADGSLQLSDRQDIVLVDEYDGNPHTSPLIKAADLIPFKPASDITFLGAAYAPDGRAKQDWLVAVKVGQLSHAIRVTGTRSWVCTAGKWRLSDPQEATEVPIDYRLAAGDGHIEGLGSPSVPGNPIGVSRPTPEQALSSASVPAPRIDDAEEDYSDPFFARKPLGLGPVAPFWYFRQRYAGTYDDAWQAHRHPQLPADFDYRFYQSAHPSMIYPGFLAGDETVEMARLTPGGGTFKFALPAVRPVATYRWRDGREVMVQLNLDGVHIDFRNDSRLIDLTWRAWLPICPNFLCINLSDMPFADQEAANLPRASLHGLTEAAA